MAKRLERPPILFSGRRPCTVGAEATASIRGGKPGNTRISGAHRSTLLFGDCLHSLHHQLLKLLQAVHVGTILRVFRPRHARRGGTTKAPHTVFSRRVGVCRLKDLDATCETDVAFTKLQPLIKLEALQKSLPAFPRHLLDGGDNDAAAGEPCVAFHVPMDKLVGLIQLRHEEVEENHRDEDGEEDDANLHVDRLSEHLLQAFIGVHAQRHLQ
mmetsp:Transcript_44376/g.103559  ORF Transcript_44376/g.103559 Transcript_44376/m.103559 type:complete len:213 (-) Transcript_44376:2567-3205(-)